MWTLNFSLVDIALRTIIIYIVVLIGIRLTRKREVGLAMLEVGGSISMLMNNVLRQLHSRIIVSGFL